MFFFTLGVLTVDSPCQAREVRQEARAETEERSVRGPEGNRGKDLGGLG